MTERIDYRGFTDKCEKIINDKEELELKKSHDSETKEIISNIALGSAYTSIQCLLWGGIIYFYLYENLSIIESIMYVFFFGGELFLIAFFTFAIFPNILLIYDFINNRRKNNDDKNIND